MLNRHIGRIAHENHHPAVYEGEIPSHSAGRSEEETCVEILILRYRIRYATPRPWSTGLLRSRTRPIAAVGPSQLIRNHDQFLYRSMCGL